MTPREHPMEEAPAHAPHRGAAQRQCTALAKSTGRRCNKAPIKGGTTCTVHGGSAPQVRAAAARRVVEEKLQAAAVTLGLPRDIGPAEALLEEIKASAGHVQWLRDRIRELEAGELTWGKVEYVEGVKGAEEQYKGTEAAKPHVLYALYAAERKTLTDLSVAALRAGVEERRVRIAEQTGALVAQAVRRILERMDLSPVQQALVGTVVPEELRALAAGVQR